MEEKNIVKYNLEDKEYPERLRNIPQPPRSIYVIGSLPDSSKPSIAIVGARTASPYGRYVAKQFAGLLARNGVQVISGMARGIDRAGHEGALDSEGSTFAILGNGVDICYPRENIDIYNKIKQTGGLISEIMPGTAPMPRFFPMRNRIISGLADIVLVVEAREKSGALITADQALEQGKDVYAVPGRVTDELSKGCNRLIMQGAGMALSVEDILKELGAFSDNFGKIVEKSKFSLATDEKSVYSCMSLQPKHMNELAEESGVGIEKIGSVLLALELQGVITEITKNYYITV